MAALVKYNTSMITAQLDLETNALGLTNESCLKAPK